MKVFLFCATGPTGQILLSDLLNDGHQVIALVRNSNRISTKHDLLTVVEGNVFNATSYVCFGGPKRAPGVGKIDKMSQNQLKLIKN